MIKVCYLVMTLVLPKSNLESSINVFKYLLYLQGKIRKFNRIGTIKKDSKKIELKCLKHEVLLL